MQARQLPERIQLQSATEALDNHGQPKKTWSTQATVRAGFQWVRAEERVMANQVTAQAEIKVLVRQDSATKPMTADWRIAWVSGPLNGRTFELVAPPEFTPDGRGVYLKCLEIV